MADLSQSRQDYLETILELARETGSVRSVDVAEKLGVSRASVSRAVGVLKQAGYIEQEPYGEIRLTELGRLDVLKAPVQLRDYSVDPDL